MAKTTTVNAIHIKTIEEGFIHKRRQGRSCCLGDKIYSIPYRTTDLAPGYLEEMDE